MSSQKENQAPWWGPFVLELAIPILRLLLPLIWEGIVALRQQLIDENIQQAETAVVEDIVLGIEKAHRDWPEEEKREMAIASFRHWSDNFSSKKISDSTVTALVSLEFAKLKVKSIKE